MEIITLNRQRGPCLKFITLNRQIEEMLEELNSSKAETATHIRTEGMI
jgi:hypothetical protein